MHARRLHFLMNACACSASLRWWSTSRALICRPIYHSHRRICLINTGPTLLRCRRHIQNSNSAEFASDIATAPSTTTISSINIPTAINTTWTGVNTNNPRISPTDRPKQIADHKCKRQTRTIKYGCRFKMCIVHDETPLKEERWHVKSHRNTQPHNHNGSSVSENLGNRNRGTPE